MITPLTHGEKPIKHFFLFSIQVFGNTFLPLSDKIIPFLPRRNTVSKFRKTPYNFDFPIQSENFSGEMSW